MLRTLSIVQKLYVFLAVRYAGGNRGLIVVQKYLKKRMRHNFQRIIRLQKQPLIFIVAFAVVGGIVLLLSSHAQSPFASSEAEKGTLASGASAVADSTASGGQAVKFGGGQVYTVPSTITADCSVSVDTQINSWIATVPDGSTLQFGANKCYGINESIMIRYRNNLTIDGNGSTFKALTPAGTNDADQNRAVFGVYDGTNIILKNLTAWGANDGRFISSGVYYYNPVTCPSYCDEEWQHGVSFTGTHGGQLLNSTVENVFGDFVEAGYNPDLGAVAAAAAQNITVSGVTMHNAARQGMGLTDTNGMLIQNSSMDTTLDSGIDMELDTSNEIDQNITIKNNTFSNIRNDFFAIVGPSNANTDKNIVIDGNTVSKQTATCDPDVLVTGGVTNLTINNNVSNIALSDWSLNGIIGGTITNNDIKYGGQTDCGGNLYAGVRLTGGSQSVTIENNTFENASSAYISDGTTSGITACMNRFSLTGTYGPAC